MTDQPTSPYAPQSSPQPTVHQAPVRPALGRRAKRGALWAGAVGFNVLTLGFYLLILPVVFLLFGALVATIVSGVGSAAGGEKGLDGVQQFLDSANLSPLAIIGVVVAIVGLAIMAGALFTSAGILKGHGIRHPWAVTWAGAGIAIVGYWCVGWIPGLLLQLAPHVLGGNGGNQGLGLGIVGGASFVVALAVNTVLGWLAWWWMAHAMRPDAASAVSAMEMQE